MSSTERQHLSRAAVHPGVPPRVPPEVTSFVPADTSSTVDSPPAAGATVLTVLFIAVGTAIAFVRFRISPWYPPMNDVNSDVYVFQMVGNSWHAGFLPYRDVYDVKGPFLYLLFGLFAWLKPWSMTPPLVFLAALASIAVWLSYCIARRFQLPRGTAAVAAVTSSVVVYLGVADVNTSFTCEEVAMPGVLLMLWLVLRELDSALLARRSGRAGAGAGSDVNTAGVNEDEARAAGAVEPLVPAVLWVVNGAAFGALFWTKYQVIAPWGAMFFGLVVLTVVGRLSLRGLCRVAGWNALGLVATTAAIRPWYGAVLPEMAQAYFLGKRSNVDLDRELPAQAAWFVRTVTENTGAALVLAGVLIVFVVAAVKTRSPRWGVLALGLTLSIWASASFVRHPNHLFVPLAFTIVAVSWLLSTPHASIRPWKQLATAGALIVAGLLVLGPLAEASSKMWLFGQPRNMTCRDVSTGTVSRERAQVTPVFAAAANNQPILSLDTLFAARTSFISQQPMRYRYEFVDHSWAWATGATRVQTRYLQDRTFDYVWVHVDDLQKSKDLSRTAKQPGTYKGIIRPEQAALLIENYEPVLACSDELLLRAS